MKKEISSKSNLFFLELIIVILLFALTSTLLLSVFVKANTIRQKSKNQTYGMIAAQSVAETIKAAKEIDRTQMTLYYDAEWHLVAAPEQGVFVIDVVSEEKSTGSGILLDIKLEVSKLDQSGKSEENIWQMSFKKYIPGYEGE